MASFSDYAEGKVLELIVGKTAFTTPTAHVALFTVTPSDSGGGTEVTGGSYARVETAGADWGSATGTTPTTITNAEEITFPDATADWGTVVAFAVFDAATNGNMLAWAALTTNREITDGDGSRFSAGTLVLTAD